MATNKIAAALLCTFLLGGRAYCQPDTTIAQSESTVTPPGDSTGTPSTAMQPAAIPVDTTSRAVPANSIPDGAAGRGEGYSLYWLIGCGLAGICLGAGGNRILAALARRKRGLQPADSPTGLADEADGEGSRMPEHEQIRLVELSNALSLENEQLKRDKAELELLLSNNHTPVMEPAQEIVFFMPQPSMNGRFQEASRRPDAADALYAFYVNPADPGSASFEFIAKDAYLNAAIGNEPSWIAIACERSNQPSGTTSMVRTDRQGLASLVNGEWEIIRKARITYL